jgi:hypothetical protein
MVVAGTRRVWISKVVSCDGAGPFGMEPGVCHAIFSLSLL